VSVANPKNGEGGVRLWCVAASDAPIICVIAKLRTDRSWTCILRWNWEKRTVEEGSWSTLRIRGTEIELSPNGEFMCYLATASRPSGPFTSYSGGATGISRLPWLTLLTNTMASPIGNFLEVKNPLPEEQQQRLWELFRGTSDYRRHQLWQFGKAFEPATSAERVSVLGVDESKHDLCASATLHGTDWRVVIGGLRARTFPYDWSVWSDRRRFIIFEPTSARALARLPDEYQWVTPVTLSSCLAASTNDGKLRLVRVIPDGDGARFEIEWEHDLSGLTPRPGPSPEWARAPLPGA
ncbi:MAG: hypothetical protein K2X32_07320, partial [Phycisphaerales bacterium]|nr:hypothetical protein [Phycisphaerales bacterium]